MGHHANDNLPACALQLEIDTSSKIGDHLCCDIGIQECGGRDDGELPMRPLQDMITVVTGAANSLGESIARRFVADGATVILSDIQVE